MLRSEKHNFIQRRRIANAKWFRLMGVLAAISTVAPLGVQAAVEPVATGKAVRAYITNFGGDGVSVVDLVKGVVVASIPTGKMPHGVAIASDGRAVYVSNEGTGTVSVIDPATNTVTATWKAGKGPNQLEVSADGAYVLVMLNGDDAVAVISTSSGKVLKTIPTGRAPHIALRSPSGDRIYVTSEGDVKVVAVDTATWKVAAEIPVLAWPRVLAISNDGARLYQTIRWLNGALVLDTAKNQVMDRIALGEPKFAVEGNLAFVGYLDHLIDRHEELNRFQPTTGSFVRFAEPFNFENHLASACVNLVPGVLCVVCVLRRILISENHSAPARFREFCVFCVFCAFCGGF